MDNKLIKLDYKVWIVAVDSDSFNYEPKEVLLSEALKEGLQFFITEIEAQTACNFENCL